MSALLDEARSVLSAFRAHVGTWVNQGLTVTIDAHLKQLEAAAALAEADAEAAVHKIFADLYTAFHAPQPDTAPETPAPATGGLVDGAGTIMIGESGPETLQLPDGAPTAAVPAEDPASDAPAEAPAVVAEPETDAPAPTES